MITHPIHLNIVRNLVRWVASPHQRISIQLVAKVGELTVRQCFRPDVSDHLFCLAIYWLDLMILYLVSCCQDAPFHMLRLLGERASVKSDLDGCLIVLVYDSCLPLL